MQQYNFTAKVERRVIDTVSLSVVTDKGPAHARKRAIETLTTGESGMDVPYCYIENRDNKELKVVDLDRMIEARIVDDDS